MENKKYIESIGQAYQQVQEKLKGGQKKLDKDGDGDIDGTDFAMMRKKKKMDEAEGKMPSMDHVQDMCDKGMSTAEMLKMHPDCDQEKLKDMIKRVKIKWMRKQVVVQTERKLVKKMKKLL